VKDTLVVQHDVGVSMLKGKDCRAALVQVCDRSLRVSISGDHTILKLELIVITGHGQLCSEEDTLSHTTSTTTHLDILVLLDFLPKF